MRNISVDRYILSDDGYCSVAMNSVFGFVCPSSDGRFIPSTCRKHKFVPLVKGNITEMNFRSFQTALNRIYSGNLGGEIRKVRIGKGDWVYTNGVMAFDTEMNPLFLKCYGRQDACTYIILSKRVLFSGSLFITNIINKIFSCFAPDKIIVDDDILNSMLYFPKFDGSLNPYDRYERFADTPALDVELVSRFANE